MPLRMKQKKPRMPRVPKAQKIPPPPKPKTRDLRIILKGYISPDVTQRLNSLAYALQWYDKALDYCIKRNKVTPDQHKSLDRAVKARKLGQSATAHEEKDQALRTAVALYEKVCSFLHPPDSKSFFKRFDEKKQVLQEKQESISDRWGGLIKTLTDAVSPKTPAGQALAIVITDSQKPFGFDPAVTQASYDRKEAHRIKIKIRREGLLPVVVEEGYRLARAAAYVPAPDGSGKYLIDPKKMLDAYFAAMQNFAKYAAGPDAPKRLARIPFVPVETSATAPEQSGQPAVPKVKRAGPPRGGKGPKIGGEWMPGSSMAVIHEALEKKIGQEVEQVELQRLVSSDVAGRLKILLKRGQETGKWKIVQNGKLWKMVQGAAHP